jgi:anti-sigma factor ChrR (cupin superfamily)
MSFSSSSADLLELLPLYAMGALDANDAADVERELAGSPALANELDRWRDAIAAFGAATGAVTPSDDVRTRILMSVGAPDGASRFDRFVAQVAELFDVTADGARAVLAKIDDAAAWRPLMPGIDCIRVSGSNHPAQAQCAFVRVAAGTTFPWHHHVGEERSLVLHGGAHLADGRDLGPGDLMVVDESVEHDFVIEGDEACIFAVRSRGLIFGAKPR